MFGEEKKSNLEKTAYRAELVGKLSLKQVPALFSCLTRSQLPQQIRKKLEKKLFIKSYLRKIISFEIIQTILFSSQNYLKGNRRYYYLFYKNESQIALNQVS